MRTHSWLLRKFLQLELSLQSSADFSFLTSSHCFRSHVFRHLLRHSPRWVFNLSTKSSHKNPFLGSLDSGFKHKLALTFCTISGKNKFNLSQDSNRGEFKIFITLFFYAILLLTLISFPSGFASLAIGHLVPLFVIIYIPFLFLGARYFLWRSPSFARTFSFGFNSMTLGVIWVGTADSDFSLECPVSFRFIIEDSNSYYHTFMAGC